MKLQIGYLRSMGASGRTRAARMHWLQSWLPIFFPERMDIAKQGNKGGGFGGLWRCVVRRGNTFGLKFFSG